jgi:hypothetical protein
MKFTQYFLSISERPDRVIIMEEWVLRVVEHPAREIIQEDGRIRRWVSIDEMGGRFLRVVLLQDGETVHNAFFDRGFTL